MSTPEGPRALPVPPQHLVPMNGVDHMAVYIEGCQPEIIEVFGKGSVHGETPDNIVPGGWVAAWRDLGNYNQRHNQPSYAEQRIRLLTLASQRALDCVEAPSLVVPEHFYALPEDYWQYIQGYFLPRRDVRAA